VRKEYVGKGERAEKAAREIVEAKAQREAEKQAIQAEQVKTSEAAKLTTELENISTLLLEAELLSAGFWQGRDYRRWRKRRGIGRQES
jgi:hypothetical protein